MKNNFSCLLIIFMSLFTNNLYADKNNDESKSVKTTQQFKLNSIDSKKYKHNILSTNDYILAKTQYNIGNYQDSYSRFYKLFLKYTDNVDVNYYLAMSAQKLKQYDEATAAFERVLIKRPEYHRARLEYARVLFILGFKKQSKEEFLIVAASPIPENVRKNINNYIDKIDQKVSSTFLSLSFGYTHDDNINTGLDDPTYTLPGFGNLAVTGDDPEQSGSHVTSVSLSHIHSLIKGVPLIAKHTAQVYNKKQLRNTVYDYQFLSYKPTIYYNDSKNKTEYSTQLGIEKSYPGDNSNFYTYTVSPQYKKLINKDNVFTAFAKYQEIRYASDTNNTKDYKKDGYGFSWKYKKLKYTINFEEDEKLKGTRNDIDKDIVEQSVSFDYDIQPKLLMFLQYRHIKKEYKDINNFFSSKREDTYENYYIGLTKLMNKTDFLTLSYSVTDNDSNHDANIYEKKAISLNYTWRFKL